MIGVWDHPRVCGEKLRAVVFGNYSEGITPAYAGKRWRPGRGPCQFRDHPRVCGEKLRFIMFIQTAIGITPAYAGKSMYRTTETLCCRDHPRVCGEKYSTRPYLSDEWGSPPRMRGKVVHFFGAHLPDGITPAYAGKSSQTAEHPSIMQDHPRVCGEKSSPTSSHRKGQGSPPRMRGKALAPAPTIDIIGITPAYAGKSRILSSFPTRFWDHPRVCGEKFTTLHGENDFWGSPPRMRGKACGLFQLVESPGITPAYAGKSFCNVACNISIWDHPRVCGEKYTLPRPLWRCMGSPPRMRGKVHRKRRRICTMRITPAYAGKSCPKSA